MTQDTVAELERLHYAHWRVLDALLHLNSVDPELLLGCIGENPLDRARRALESCRKLLESRLEREAAKWEAEGGD